MSRLFAPGLALALYLALSALVCLVAQDRDGGILRLIGSGVFLLVALEAGKSK